MVEKTEAIHALLTNSLSCAFELALFVGAKMLERALCEEHERKGVRTLLWNQSSHTQH